MPIYDRKCEQCGNLILDCYESVNHPDPSCECGGVATRVWLPGKANAVIGDEIDIEIKHGLCLPDGTPRRFRSRAELAKAALEKGYTNRVEHLGTMSGDKSKHTTRWT